MAGCTHESLCIIDVAHWLPIQAAETRVTTLCLRCGREFHIVRPDPDAALAETLRRHLGSRVGRTIVESWLQAGG